MIRDARISQRSDAEPPVSGQSVQRPGRTHTIALAGLCIALLTVSAWVSIPLGPVPFTLQVFVVVLTALLLEPRAAAGAFGGYLLLGALGLPVFSRMQGGVGVLVGPTGGYLIGFVAGGILASIARAVFERRVSPWLSDAIAAFTAIAIVYVVGATQLGVVAGMGPGKAFAAGVVPFIALDAAKAVAAIGVAAAVRRALPRFHSR